MKVLLLSTFSGLYEQTCKGYNGGGWVSSLQRELEKVPDVELALAFHSVNPSPKERKGRTTYYPIYTPPRRNFSKLFYYWYGYRKDVFNNQIKNNIQEIIKDFSPDVIHLFGTESDMGYILGETNVPCLLHLQGILSLSIYIYYPPGIDESIIRKPFFNIRERWLKNGFCFKHDRMELAAKREIQFMQKAKYVTGRTDWDKHFTLSHNPNAQYFHINEILRPAFYNAKKWEYTAKKELTIVSTISDTLYKGLDLILKTAQQLTKERIKFTWNVIGLTENSETVRLFEKVLGIQSSCVHIHYIGISTPEQIIKTLQEASVYVHPSYIDNSPNSLCEAQYIGVPVLAVNTGGVSSILFHEKNKLLPANNPSFLTRKLIEQQKHPQETGESIQKAIERHDPKKIIASLLQTYKYIINDHKRTV